ncbi:hypothetical protein B0H10DRAFT_1943083 [Mycena sp. CBHHK59/15]|nr:hypothetical protein B0H10DRAFT_1943083 [Mycena sp. CBHHK59/15]
MSLLPSAGIPAPIPDSFDFDAWVIPPPSKNPAGRTLQLRNQHNLHAERFNETSFYQTLNCKEDRVAYPDVGPPLKVFYTYMAEDMAEMVLSEGYCTDVGPLPAFICREVEHAIIKDCLVGHLGHIRVSAYFLAKVLPRLRDIASFSTTTASSDEIPLNEMDCAKLAKSDSLAARLSPLYRIPSWC